jgi:hypothetical protein
MIGFVMSVSKDPKYATPAQNPRKAQGIVKAFPEVLSCFFTQFESDMVDTYDLPLSFTASYCQVFRPRN